MLLLQQQSNNKQWATYQSLSVCRNSAPATNVNCVSALACYTRLRSLNLKGPTDLRMYTVRARYTLRTQQILTPVILGVIRGPRSVGGPIQMVPTIKYCGVRVGHLP